MIFPLKLEFDREFYHEAKEKIQRLRGLFTVALDTFVGWSKLRAKLEKVNL